MEYGCAGYSVTAEAYAQMADLLAWIAWAHEGFEALGTSLLLSL
jgi:hypothetical protein